MIQIKQRLPLLCVSCLLLLISLGGCGGSSSFSDPLPPDTDELPTTGGSLVSATSDASFIGEHYSGSGTYARCHDGLTSNEGDISIVRKWSTSMMANASRDPYWQAKFSSELSRNPQLSDELNNTCSRCHTPMANDSVTKFGGTPELFGSGYLNPENPYFDHAMDGVSCSFCHQIEDTPQLGTLNGFSGNYSVAEHSNKMDRPTYGQYLDPVVGPMQNNVEFTPQFGAHIRSSALCATCHNLKTPFVDDSGNIASTSPETEFPEQMVYTEWENSMFSGNGAEGSIKDVDLDRDSTVFEPHYELITQQDQVQVYEPIMADTNGDVTHTLLRATDYLKDNRLPPKGYNKLSVPNDIRVAGAALDDDNFNDGSDTVTYKINVGNNSKLTIRAELKYQALSYGHLQDLFKDKHIRRVAEFKAMFDDASIRAETIASANLLIE